MNSTILDLGFFQIKWYSVILLIAITIAAILVYREARGKGLDQDTFIDMVFYGLLIGIVGARAYYVLFNLNYYLKDPIEIICVWHGGLAIHGGLLATLTFLYFFTKKKKMNLLLILDMIVVGLIIGQAIGRWGNFFNGEAFGRTVSLAYLKSLHIPAFIIKGMYINKAYREPTFLYESISCMIGFIVLLIIRSKVKIKTGVLTSIYLIWYGVMRVMIESIRSDSLMLGPVKVAQLVSIIGIIIGIVMIIRSKDRKYYKKDKINQK